MKSSLRVEMRDNFTCWTITGRLETFIRHISEIPVLLLFPLQSCSLSLPFQKLKVLTGYAWWRRRKRIAYFAEYGRGGPKIIIILLIIASSR